MAEEKQTEQVIRHEHVSIRQEPELKITLNRGQRGGYGWEIQYSGTDKKELLHAIGEADRELREKYLSEGLCPPK
jgi:hypothetical protein